MTAADISLEVAEDADVPAVAALMNLAYRGRGEHAGWSVEADYIDGDRTSEALLRQDIAADPHGKLLLWRGSEAGVLVGCVWLRPEGEGRWYLGSLAVDPRRQAGGLGTGDRRFFVRSDQLPSRRPRSDGRPGRANVLRPRAGAAAGGVP